MIVAIIGRPNVGKSTFFNRLVEQNASITESQPGVTRDRLYGMSEWSGKKFTVVDTGGYVEGSEDQYEKEINTQISIAIEEANIIIFMVDCKSGLSAFDENIAKILRKVKKPVFLVSNKADNLANEFLSNEFYKLGLGKVYPISAINGFGTGELLDEIIQVLPVENKVDETENLPKISILGRPNVGKSSFLNNLIGKNRSIVTSNAGTTRDSTNTLYNLYGKKLVLTDTAGIRKKNKVTENIEFYSVIRSIKALENSDVCLVMLDASHGIEAQDLNIIDLAQKRRKGIVILVNKWDLITKDHTTMEEFRKNLAMKLGGLNYIPILFISVLNKQRIYQSIDIALKVYDERQRKISTSKLNDILLKIVEKNPPPANKGKYIKIKYITQLPTKATNFAFFCNLPQYIKQPYKNFLENQIRKHFGFEGVPINIIFKKK